MQESPANLNVGENIHLATIALHKAWQHHYFAVAEVLQTCLLDPICHEADLRNATAEVLSCSILHSHQLIDAFNTLSVARGYIQKA